MFTDLDGHPIYLEYMDGMNTDPLCIHLWYGRRKYRQYYYSVMIDGIGSISDDSVMGNNEIRVRVYYHYDTDLVQVIKSVESLFRETDFCKGIKHIVKIETRGEIVCR